MQKIHLIGNAHLDPVWLWQWQEGFAEIKATYRSALDRMKEYDDFIFTSACGAYYMWIEKIDPEMFDEIRQRVKEGRWKLVGGWFIQPDCNIPCGESFARHALITQRYFEEKFGVMAQTGYNVDSFGHNGNLPMILQNSRMKNYVFMRPGPHEKTIPNSLFTWESRDGSQVTTYRIPFHYNLSKNEQYELFEDIAKLAEEEGNDEMAFYGIGNHGGGPTVALLNKMHDILDDRFVYSHPDALFDSCDKSKLPVLREDLQYHAKGCYSAMSEIKANNRRSENALLRAEKFSILSGELLGAAYPAAELDRAWKNTLFNQFHDILDGCAIRESYDDARDVHGMTLATAADLENIALQRISWNIDTVGNKATERHIPEELAEEIGYPVVVFNPHAYEVTDTVYIRSHKNRFYHTVSDNEGNIIPMQTVRDSKTNRKRKYARLFEVTIPAFGYRVYRLYHHDNEVEFKNPFTVTENSIANSKIKVAFDSESGEICSLYDLEKGRELLAGSTRIGLYNDRNYDTWAHGIESFKDERPMKIKSKLSVTETGPVRATVRVEQTFGKSTIVRDYSILPDSDRVTVKTKVDFHEKFRILKLELPVNCKDGKSLCKIPFGVIERPTDGTEQVCGDWISLFDEKAGIGLASDAKHSYDADGNKLSLTVLRSPIYADHFANEVKTRDEFCEFMEQGIQRFTYTLFPYKGCADAEKNAALMQNPVVAVPETFHQGRLSAEYQGISVSKENVIVTAVKQHVSGKGIILRCYEAEDKDTDVTVNLFGTSFDFHIPHSGVKTFLILDGKVTETDFIE
ncbi:MAG: alpha-mannosidase [Clostridia bacterium]|nr:alpha-mannosidase [Clostridia bacterium]